MKRLIIQESEKANHYVVTDQTNGIVIVFEKGKYNETQKVTNLKNTDPNDFMLQARQMREVGEWLMNFHKEKLY
jgi:hypothetical protein